MLNGVTSGPVASVFAFVNSVSNAFILRLKMYDVHASPLT